MLINNVINVNEGKNERENMIKNIIKIQLSFSLKNYFFHIICI